MRRLRPKAERLRASAEARSDVALLSTLSIIDAKLQSGKSPSVIYRAASCQLHHYYNRAGVCRSKACRCASMRCVVCCVPLRCPDCKEVQIRAVLGKRDGVMSFTVRDAVDFCKIIATPVGAPLQFDVAASNAALEAIMEDARAASKARATETCATVIDAEPRHAAAFAALGARATALAYAAEAVLCSHGVCVNCVTAVRLGEAAPPLPSSVQSTMSMYARASLLPPRLLFAAPQL